MSANRPSQLDVLPQKERRGSRARCLLLTEGSVAEVAQRLTDVAAPFASIDPARHVWLPQGFSNPREAKLGDEAALLSGTKRETLTAWWLAVRTNANTPNWDIVSTCTINGQEGLLLVEAKAHAAELHKGGKPKGRAENDASIGSAIAQASAALKQVVPDWALSAATCYQLCNRFAWAWKLAMLGTPVLLVYLGFLHAEEMRDQGAPLTDQDDWERLVRNHGRGLVPNDAWERPLDIAGTPFQAIIRSVEIELAVGGTRG